MPEPPYSPHRCQHEFECYHCGEPLTLVVPAADIDLSKLDLGPGKIIRLTPEEFIQIQPPEIVGTLEYAGGSMMEFAADDGEPFMPYEDGDKVAITIRPLETGKTPPAETAS